MSYYAGLVLISYSWERFLHDFSDPLKVLLNARKMIKPSGRLINLDWKKEPLKFGPPLQIKFSEEKAPASSSPPDLAVESTAAAGLIII